MPFFRSKGNLSVFKHVSKIMFRGMQIASQYLVFKVKRITTNPTNPYFILATFRTFFFSPHSLSNTNTEHIVTMNFIRILGILWRMLVSEKSLEIQVCSVSNLKSDGNILLFGMRENRIKRFTLFFKVSQSYLLL